MSMPNDAVPVPAEAAVPAVVVLPPWSIDALVDHLVAARNGGPRIAAERVAATVTSLAAAYRVQAAVDAALWPDAEPTVWKAGADSRDSLPTAAPIAPALVVENGGTFASSAFPVRIVEAEIAYRFGVDLPPRDTAYTTDEVHDAVASMHAAIEIVSPRIADFQAATPLAKLADHGLSGGFVLGDGIKAWRKVALRAQPATLSFDGRIVEAFEGSHALGNPAVLLPWFVAYLGRQRTRDGGLRGVRAGDVVTTGSWSKVIEAKPKQRVEADFPGIGRASLTFTS